MSPSFVWANAMFGYLQFWVFSPEGNSNTAGDLAPTLESKGWGRITSGPFCLAAVQAAYPEVTNLKWDPENKLVLGDLPDVQEALDQQEKAHQNYLVASRVLVDAQKNVKRAAESCRMTPSSSSETKLEA